MRPSYLCLALWLGIGTIDTPSAANFVRINIDRPANGRVRMIWRPYAGAVGDGAAQQAALQRRSLFPPNADSVARWRDERARDTVVRGLPVTFTVDMSGGPVIVESLTTDSVRATVQLTPERGPLVETWGREMLIESDGRAPRITRVR
jgi:hypothetical protein